MRIWRVVFWESEFFEKASQKKKNQISSGKKKRFHNSCLINQTGILDNSTRLRKSKKQRIPNTKSWNWFFNRIWSGIEHHQQSYLEWNQKFTSKNNTLKNNKQASDSTRLNLNKLWKKTILLPGYHSNNGTKQTLEQTIQTNFPNHRYKAWYHWNSNYY